MTMILNKRRAIILSVIGFILLLPVIGMQFSTGVDWNALDFIIATFLLLLIGFGVDFAISKSKTTFQKIIFVTIVLGIGFLIWAELAVGIFGSPFAGS